MIHCPRCGKANGDDFKFCLGCGADLAAAVALVAGAVASSTRGTGAPLPSIPSPPRKPSPRAKAIIHAYTGTQKVLRTLGVVFTLIGCAIGIPLGHGVALDLAIAVAGKPAQGTVVNTRVLSNVEVNGRHPHEITFTVNGRQGSSSTLDSAFTNGMDAGHPVQIETVPGFPIASRVRGTTVSAMGVFGLFPLIFALVGAPLWIGAVRSNNREIRAFVTGTGTVGRVVSMGFDTSTKINGRHPVVLKWEFDIGGRAYTGSLSHMELGVLSPLVSDGKVPVVYDPKDPRTNTLYVA